MKTKKSDHVDCLWLGIVFTLLGTFFGFIMGSCQGEQAILKQAEKKGYVKYYVGSEDHCVFWMWSTSAEIYKAFLEDTDLSRTTPTPTPTPCECGVHRKAEDCTIDHSENFMEPHQ